MTQVVFRINISPLSAAYMRRWTGSGLVQIMACRLDGTKPLPEPMLTYCQLEPKEHLSVKFYLKFKYLYSRNAFEHVCKMATILSRGRSVNVGTALESLVLVSYILLLLCVFLSSSTEGGILQTSYGQTEIHLLIYTLSIYYSPVGYTFYHHWRGLHVIAHISIVTLN